MTNNFSHEISSENWTLGKPYEPINYGLWQFQLCFGDQDVMILALQISLREIGYDNLFSINFRIVRRNNGVGSS